MVVILVASTDGKRLENGETAFGFCNIIMTKYVYCSDAIVIRKVVI